MIGILKALGSQNNQIKKIFMSNGLKLILLGMFIANIISVSIGLLQEKYKILKLDKESYYMEYVPISWDPILFFQLNIIIFIIIYLVMFIPILIINKIKILNSIKFN